jgi:predicted lipoprotein with Yx(FWY)xxD motif
MAPVAASRKDSQVAARRLRSERPAAPPPRPHQGTERGSTLRTHRALITTAIGILATLSAAATAAAPAAAAPARDAGQATASQAAAGAAVVVTTTTSKFGRVLVTGSRMSLYLFTGDGFPPIACTALNKEKDGTKCTTVWPPLLATGRLVAKGGVRQAGLGTVTRNHVKQVTYFGHPLYRFVNDVAAGQMNGQNYPQFDGQWYLDLTTGRPAIGVASVMTEPSGLGTVLAGRTALGRRTLYTLSFDTPNTTTCTGACQALWPPLLTSARAKAGPGVSQAAIGTLRRPDGTLQVTYHGHPVYMFSFDLALPAPKKPQGEYLIDPAASGVWYAVTPRGTPDPGTTIVGSEPSGTARILAITAGLTHATATLYAFSIDTRTMSKCTGMCAKFWPPVLTTRAVKAGPGVNQHMLGTLRRADGTLQVSYNGHPLYFFALGLNSGTSGAGAPVFGGVFNLVNTNGTVGGGGGW